MSPARKPLNPSSLPGSLVRLIVNRSRPTILYESAPPFWLRFSSVSAAVFCVGVASISYYYNVMHPPPDLVWYVPLAYQFVCILLAMMGWLFLVSTALSVRRITAMPTASLPAAYRTRGPVKMSPAAERAFQALLASPIALQCDVAGSLPLVGARKIIAAPGDVIVPFHWRQMPVAQGGAAAAGQSVYMSFRRGLLAEGFLPIMIKGKRCKVDVLAGTLFDKGRALEYLMPCKPRMFSNSWVDRLLKR